MTSWLSYSILINILSSGNIFNKHFFLNTVKLRKALLQGCFGLIYLLPMRIVLICSNSKFSLVQGLLLGCFKRFQIFPKKQHHFLNQRRKQDNCWVFYYLFSIVGYIYFYTFGHCSVKQISKIAHGRVKQIFSVNPTIPAVSPNAS